MKRQIFLLTFLSLALAACGNEPAPETETGIEAETQAMDEPASRANPLLEEWDTSFGVPPFDRIKSEDYLPAIRTGIAEQQAEIDMISANPEPATFANTIEAMERSGATFGRVYPAFNGVDSSNTDDILTETAKVIAPELAAHNDNIVLNMALFERVNAVYEARDNLGLTAEQTRLLEEVHKRFIRAGAALDDASQARLRDINAELASLAQQFGEKLLNETNNFELLVTDRADLGNLSENLVSLAAAEARQRGHECECWAFTLQRPSINPFLQYSPNRELRREIFDAYAARGDNDNENDNKAGIARAVQLRAERSALLGYKNHAEFVLADNMAETSENVYALLDAVWKPALRVAKEERAAREKMMHADGIDDRLRGWDWRYYTEKVRKAEYDFDEDSLLPYFETNAVRDGAFALSTKLFGLQFEQRDDLPRWHEDQQVFEVKEADGSHLAILYMDFYARDSKRGGAWMNELRSQSKYDGNVTAIVTNDFNFPAPTDSSPSLIGLIDAETVFHEFGHALHGMFSNVNYTSLAGTNTPRDFVEFPSQVMENWMREPEVLNLFARHYQTGEPIPQEIVDKVQATAKFDQGFITVEFMAAAYLDMAYHVLDSTEAVEPSAFEKAAMADIELIEEIIPRYKSGYYAHIFDGGYASGYYGYLWSEVLDADAFQAFKETSLFDPETAARYREEILSKGGTAPSAELYRNFRGRDPVIGPLLENRGLN
jgi:peptidyl-dipeptidase Dcp